MTLGELIVEYRTDHNLSQRAFAKNCGISYSYISLIERNVSPQSNNPVKPTLSSLKMIASGMGITLHELLSKIDDTSVTLERSPVPDSPEPIKVPVYGRIAAGVPIIAEEEIIDYEEISMKMSELGEIFGLQIVGDSMEPRLKTGDVAIILRQPNIESGQVAAVLIGNEEATLKKVIIRDNGITLIPFNPAFKPMNFSAKEVEELPVTIIGRMIESRCKW